MAKLSGSCETELKNTGATIQTLLHISDIHFGWDRDEPSKLAERQVCLDSMLGVLKDLDPEWQPTIVCLTGDVGWSGIQTDYEAAKKWLDSLLSTCKLTMNELVLCPGNHDNYRPDAEKVARPNNEFEADKILSPPISEHLIKLSNGFCSFAKAAGIPPLMFGKDESYLVGQRSLNGIEFICLNSAWNAKDGDDKEKLWIGLPLLKYMEAAGQLNKLGQPRNKPCRIVLMHHPEEWLHPNEKHASNSRPNTWDYISHRCSVLLTGHTHGEVRGSDRISDGAIHFTGGSTFAGDSHFNSFRLIRLDSENIVDRAFEFDPRSADTKWIAHDPSSRPFASLTTSISVTQKSTPTFNLQTIRNAFKKNARTILDQKSRLLRQTGQLPAFIDRPVSVRTSTQTPQYDDHGYLIRPNKSETTMPIYDAVREGRRTLLLGDLGTGKSTLAAHLVIENIERSESSVAVFIPVKSLGLSDILTQRALLNSLSQYISDEILTTKPGFCLEELLKNHVEVLVVFDGLDEIERQIAARVLRHAVTLSTTWPSIQVVATARPIELAGVAFTDWRIVNTTGLDDTAKKEFIRHELLADGIPVSQLYSRTTELFKLLKDMVFVDNIANSPLSIRLIYPRIKEISVNSSFTLGDLLYDLLLERIDGWQKRDDKPAPFTHLQQIFPTPEAKAELLSVLAEKTLNLYGRQIRVDEAKALFEETARKFPDANPVRVAGEAVQFFEWLGLISIARIIEFPLQPLVEITAAAGLATRWNQDNVKTEELSPQNWRAISFVATIVRRRGQLDRLRKPLLAYIESLLAASINIAAACYIVAEADDAELASSVIGLFNKKGYRPLRVFQNERQSSARNIARSLYLAGDTGFTWFYNEYLNPIYPTPNLGSAIIEDIFKEWAAMIQPSLTSDQRDKLSTLVSPYIATDEGHFFGVLPILSTLIPEAFPILPRIWYQSQALDNSLFCKWVNARFTEYFNNSETKKTLQEVLLARATESVSCARLWLESNLTSYPTVGIIYKAIAAAIKREPNDNEGELENQCRERLGETVWMRFARWAVTDSNSDVRAGAAKLLFDTGERRLSVLGDALLDAMHHSFDQNMAAELLTVLLKERGNDGVKWLVRRMMQSDPFYGAPPAWWRLFLINIETLENAPRLLSNATRKIGPHVIPRYPEIRESFKRIFNGPHGEQYRACLHSALKSLDPLLRMGAAMVLVSTDPHGQAEALEVVVRSRSGPNKHRFDEWEEYLMTLDFSPSVLSYLSSKLPCIDSASRPLALALLQKGNLLNNPQLQAELTRSITSWDYFQFRKVPECNKLLSTENAFMILSEQLEHTDNSIREKVSTVLLDLHRNRLSPMQVVKCGILQMEGRFGKWTITDILMRLETEPDLCKAMDDISIEIHKNNDQLPIALLVKETLKNKHVWKDIVWALLCDDTRLSRSSESDIGGMELLSVGLKFEKHAEGIGRAAEECLMDPRMKQNRYADAFHWLALLAHEFGMLKKEDLKDIILNGSPIQYSAITALIARLGNVPEGFSRRTQRRHPPEPLPISTQKPKDIAEITTTLKEYSRDSDALHPNLHSTLQESFFLNQLDEQALQSFSQAGKPGIMVSTILRFVYGMNCRMSDTIPILDTGSKLWEYERNQQRSDLHQFYKIWHILRESAILEVPAERHEYLTSLDKALSNDETWKIPIAWDILEVRGHILDDQIPVVFSEFAQHPTFLHYIVFCSLCKWLSQELSPNTISVLVESANRVIVGLDEAPIGPDKSHGDNPLADLLFPAIVWAFGKNQSIAAKMVFLRGMRSVIEKVPNQRDYFPGNIVSALAHLDPLLARVPESLLIDMISTGVDSNEPSISAFCRLIAAFSKTRSKRQEGY